MKYPMHRLALALVLAGLAGCQSDGKPLTPVAGKVTFDGQPLAGARITFFPVGQTLGHGGYAITGADGSYEISAFRSNNRKGLLPGSYKVSLSRWLLPDGKPLPRDVPEQGSGARESVPQIYTRRDLTPLSATVETEPGTFDFNLQKQ